LAYILVVCARATVKHPLPSVRTESAIVNGTVSLNGFPITSLICDPEEYNFENLDQLPEGSAAIFVIATYRVGEPTDNAVQLIQNFTDESFEFSSGSHRLDGIKYVVFGLGNKMYDLKHRIAVLVQSC